MYQLTDTTQIIKTENDEVTIIPADDRNYQYQQYLKWISNGNTAQPADPLPTLPIRVSSAQFHMALIQLNLFNQVQTETAQNQLMQVFFDRSPYFVSDDPKIISVANALGLQGQIGAVFALAESL